MDKITIAAWSDEIEKIKTAGAKRLARLLTSASKKPGLTTASPLWSAAGRSQQKLQSSMLRRGQMGPGGLLKDPGLGRTMAHASPKQRTAITGLMG